MPIPPIIVHTAKKSWNWQWNQLMNALAPSDKEGNYVRPKTNLNANNNLNLSLENLNNRSGNELPGLIIGRSCPWAHRCWIIHTLKDLKSSINLHIAKVDRSKGKWILDPPILKCNTLEKLYISCGKTANYRPTVPLLFDPVSSKDSKPSLISNESLDLIEILNKWGNLNINLELNPPAHQKELNYWKKLIHHKINNGVYLCGFARNQKAYSKASNDLFVALNKVDESLRIKGPWLCGEEITIADILLFPTLIRWEIVYQPLFKCSQKPLDFFSNIIRWRRKFFNTSQIPETCDSQAWRNDYFGALFPMNPSNIIPISEDIDSIINHQTS